MDNSKKYTIYFSLLQGTVDSEGNSLIITEWDNVPSNEVRRILYEYETGIPIIRIDTSAIATNVVWHIRAVLEE